MRESSSPILFRRRYLYRTAYRLTALILILILMLISTAACMSEQGQSNETLEAISTSSQINLPPPATTIKPGTGELRLVAKPQDYSPLKPATAEQKGIYSLLYQTLFSIDDMGYICPEIAADYRWSNDRLKIKIDLEPGLEFSDGTILKPEDVKASIESWIANRDGSSTAFPVVMMCRQDRMT